MKKLFLSFVVIIMALSLFACGKKQAPATMSLGGIEYPSEFVRSGYYFDKASLSDATLIEMLNKVEVIDKPEDLGEVTLPDFSKITLTNNKKEDITSAMIEAEIEKERDKEVTFSPVKVKREAVMTDKVTIDFKGFVDGKELEGGAGENYELILGSGQFIPGFEEKVAGHKAGQKFTINVKFPDEYTPELAGKDATFEITIKSMEEANTPEVNDDFVKTHTAIGAKTIDEYKEEMRQRIADRQEFMNNQNLIYQLSEKLLPECKFSPTEEALAWQFSMVIAQIKAQAEQNGMSMATMLSSSGGSIKDAYDEIKSSIPEYIEQVMLMDTLTKRYKITMTEDDVKKWFDTMSSVMGYGTAISYDDYKNYMGYEALRDSAIQEKSLLKACEECKIVDEEVEE